MTMSHIRMSGVLAAAALATLALSAATTMAGADDGPNAAPNPYRVEEGWAKLPEGRKWGMTIGLEVARDGKSLWVFDRCGGNTCENSNIDPITKYDASGKVVVTFGA
jgi:hypothetical protein